MEKRKNMCDILFVEYKKKSFLHRMATGYENEIYLENPKRSKTWVDPGPAIHIEPMTESLCQKDDALYLVGPVRRSL